MATKVGLEVKLGPRGALNGLGAGMWSSRYAAGPHFQVGTVRTYLRIA